MWIINNGFANEGNGPDMIAFDLQKDQRMTIIGADATISKASMDYSISNTSPASHIKLSASP
jgi:hypothetical protein